jgi:hypothetical protein
MLEDWDAFCARFFHLAERYSQPTTTDETVRLGMMIESLRLDFAAAVARSDEAAMMECMGEAHRATVTYVFDQILDYLAHLRSDFETFARHVSLWLRVDDSGPLLDGTIAFHLNADDLSFSIAVQPTADPDAYQLYLSGGAIQAIDDLALAGFSQPDFFTAPGCDWQRDGFTLLDTSRLRNAIRPMERFWDYQLAVIDLVAAEPGAPMTLDLVGAYWSAIPIGDPDRLRTAGLVSLIALTWLVAHEECHYRNGHFLLDDELKAEFDGDEEVGLHRTIEWNADQSATRAIVDIFFDDLWANALPPQCAARPEWLVRLILTGIALPILIVDRGIQLGAPEGEYPAATERLVGQIVTLFARIQEGLSHSAAFVPSRPIPYSPVDRDAQRTFIRQVVTSFIPDLATLCNRLELETATGIGRRYGMGGAYDPPLPNLADPSAWIDEMVEACSNSLTGERGRLGEDGRLNATVFDRVRLLNIGDDLFRQALQASRTDLHGRHREKISRLTGRSDSDPVDG